jgi:adenylate cyclase
MSELIRQHRDRVVDSPGDNLLAEFTSVADGVQCAEAKQNSAESAEEVSEGILYENKDIRRP